MKHTFRVICLTLASILLLASCASLTDDEVVSDVADTEAHVSENVETGASNAHTEFDGLILTSGKKTDYILIKPVNTTVDVADEIYSFTSWFAETTGATLYTELESAASLSDKEIVINCSSESRADAKAAYDETAYTGYDIRVSGNRIIVTAHSSIHLKKAFGYLREGIVKAENGYGIAKDYKASGFDGFGADVPKYVTNNGSVEGVYYCGNDAYEVSMVNTTLAEAQNYVSTLLEKGFSQYALNTMGEEDNENYFYTLVKDSATVFVNYYKYLKSARIVISNPELYLPSTERPTYESVVTPSLSQTARDGTEQDAPGTSMIFQLSDASFIIVDGGPVDDGDCDALMDFLDEKTPGDAKPVISAWMITHSHGDHVGLASAFIDKYYSRVDVRMIAYNFPDFNTVKISGEAMTNTGANTFITKVKKRFPNAERFVFHAGQKLYIADAEIEILFTHEDLYPKAMESGNHSSSMWTVTINGNKTIVLGDSEKSLCQQAADCFGEYLKSDILQVSHHGFNGACIELYQYIDPQICLWSCDKWRFEGSSHVQNSDGSRKPDRRTLGENEDGSVWKNYEFNYWLRNTGNREHYHAQQDTTILFAAD